MQVLNGNGDTVQCLERALERAKAGELVGAVIIEVTERHTIGWTYGWNEGVQPMFALALAALMCAQHDIVSQGLGGE